jgi:hypothetical protein
VIQAGTSFLVPGLGQLLVGERLKGIVLFFVTLFFVSLAYFFRGRLTNLFLMVALSFHGYSVSDCLRSLPEMRGLFVRFLVSFMVILALAVYYTGIGHIFSFDLRLYQIIRTRI